MMYFATVYPGCAALFDLWCLLCLIVAFVGSPPFVGSHPPFVLGLSSICGRRFVGSSLFVGSPVPPGASSSICGASSG